MSRIGKQPVVVPSGVKVNVTGNMIAVEGPKGKPDWKFRSEVSVAYDEGAKQIVVSRDSDARQSRALHGLTRALIQNMVIGVSEGYEAAGDCRRRIRGSRSAREAGVAGGLRQRGEEADPRRAGRVLP